MAQDRDYYGEDEREYPSGPSYSGQDGWSGGYGNPSVTSWQSGVYGQGSYEHPHAHQGEFYGSVYDRSSTSHGHSDFTADAADNCHSFYDYGRHTQSAFPVDTSQVPYYHHIHVSRDAARPCGASHHQHSAHVTPPPAHTSLSAPQEQLDKSGQQSIKLDVSTASDPSSHTDYAGSFLAQVQKYVARHREPFDLLVKGHRGREDEIHHNAHSGEMYEFGEPDALEYHMSVEPHLRYSRFLELVSVGDVVRGHVTNKSPRELGIQVTSFVGTHKHRELSDIGVKGLVPFDNLADSAEKCNRVLGEMELDDVIQGIIIYQKENGCLVLSFRGDHIEQLCADGQLPSGVRIGYMEGKRPLTPRSGIPKPGDYLNQLKEDPGFLNPSSSDNLKLVLGIHSSSGTLPLAPGRRPTLIKDFQKEEFAESDYCHALRKAQRSKWSMDTVAVGVKHFKAGENSKAMKYFDHALEIDGSNVEGLVARGALFANDGKFKEGISDFEKALTLKHTHRNARNYLVQTQVAYGDRLEKDGKLEEAVQCYREALADDPRQQTAKARLDLITAALEKQAAEKRELERKKLEEKATLKKLRKLIEKEREKRKVNKKSKGTKTKRKRAKESKSSKRKKKVSSRTKVKKEHRRRQTSSEEYLSDESTDTASSDYSRSRSPKLSRQRRRRSPGSRSRSPRASSRSPKSKSRSPRSRSRSVSRSPRSRTKRTKSRSRTPHVRSKVPSKSKSGSRRSVSASLSDSSSPSPSRKYTSKHKHSRDHQL